MKISILTLFPEMFAGPFDHSIVKRAKEKGLVEINFINIRDFGEGKHQIVDDTPYGGGIGMILRVDIVHKAIEHVKRHYSTMSSRQLKGGEISKQEKEEKISLRQLADRNDKTKVILMTASGKTFNQPTAKAFSQLDHLIIICGHYEGIDDRIKEFIDEEISIGDFVLTGGEIPAMAIVDAVSRLIPGVITQGATEDESFATTDNQTLLEYPQYTKPQEYKGKKVPDVLLSGDHKKIAQWRREKAAEKTRRVRPDLLPLKEGNS